MNRPEVLSNIMDKKIKPRCQCRVRYNLSVHEYRQMLTQSHYEDLTDQKMHWNKCDNFWTVSWLGSNASVK